MANCIKCGKSEVVMLVMCSDCVNSMDEETIVREYLKKEVRICESFYGCVGCPLEKLNCHTCVDQNDIDNRVKVVLDWEESHEK